MNRYPWRHDPWRTYPSKLATSLRRVARLWCRLSLEVRGFLIWVAALLALGGLLWLTGCKASGRALSPEDIAAVVAGVANVQQNETDAGRDVISQAYDQWAPRLDAMRRFVDALRRWSIWLILGIPAVTYIGPKILWIIVQRAVRNMNNKGKRKAKSK